MGQNVATEKSHPPAPVVTAKCSHPHVEDWNPPAALARMALSARGKDAAEGETDQHNAPALMVQQWKSQKKREEDIMDEVRSVAMAIDPPPVPAKMETWWRRPAEVKIQWAAPARMELIARERGAAGGGTNQRSALAAMDLLSLQQDMEEEREDTEEEKEEGVGEDVEEDVVEEEKE